VLTQCEFAEKRRYDPTFLGLISHVPGTGILARENQSGGIKEYDLDANFILDAVCEDATFQTFEQGFT
jgi:hypothetical protein